MQKTMLGGTMIKAESAVAVAIECSKPAGRACVCVWQRVVEIFGKLMASTEGEVDGDDGE